MTPSLRWRSAWMGPLLIMLCAVPALPGQPRDDFAPAELPPLPPSILDSKLAPIDLCSALRLAGVQNPEIMIARERVVEAVARHQLAAAQILPNLNAGLNFDDHLGNLQQSTGAILKVNRDAMYLGLGASAVGAGTVNIPGIVWNLKASDAIFGALASKQAIRQRQFASRATDNQVLLRVAQSYLTLLRAECQRAIASQNRDEGHEVARITANYAKAGQGRQADAERAVSELEQRNNELLDAENSVLSASARLCELLGLDASVRLHAIDGWVVPAPIVPEPIPLTELIAIALTQRPELGERQAAIREAMLVLRGAKLLPFSPNLIVGYSAGSFGGGSDIVAAAGGSRFGNFNGRQDLDAVVYWELRNLGVGNLAMIRGANSNLRTTQWQQTEVLDRVRAEVARAYARTHARFAQIDTSERAVAAGAKAFQEDLLRTRNREGLPIEVLDSLRLVRTSRQQYLDAIIDYNAAHFELYVALGNPPAAVLARPVPASLVPPPPEAGPPISGKPQELLPVPNSK